MGSKLQQGLEIKVGSGERGKLAQFLIYVGNVHVLDLQNSSNHIVKMSVH